MSTRAARRVLSLIVSMAVFVSVAGCGSGSDRERNVQTIAGQVCTKAGQSKTVSKIVNVCGRNGSTLVWFAAVSRKPKGEACGRSGDVRTVKGVPSVCATVNKKRMWVDVAALPFSPSTVSTVAGADAQGNSATTSAPAGSAGEQTTTASSIASAASGLTKSAEEAFADLASPSAVPRDDIPSRTVTPEEVVAFAKTTLPAVRLAITSKPTASRNGGRMTPVPQFQMVDVAGGARPVANIEVRVASTTFGVEVLGGVARTDESGAVAFPDLVLSGPAGRVDLAVFAEGYEGSSFTVEHAVGVPVAIVELGRLHSLTAGAPWGRSLRVQLVDVDRFLAPVGGVSLKASATDAKGRMAILGTSTTDESGSAIFADAALKTVGTTTVVIEAETPGIESAEFEVQVFPADADGLSVISEPPSQVANGTIFPSATRVQLVDEFGNAITRAGVKVRAEAMKDDGEELAIAGSAATTDAAGIATFDQLAVVGKAGSISVAFSTPEDTTLKGTRGFVTQLVAGKAAMLQFPLIRNARSGIPLEQAQMVWLVDESENRVIVEGREVQVVADRSVVLSNDTATFGADGTAVFKGLTITGKEGPLKLTYVFGDLTGEMWVWLYAGPIATLTVRTHPREIVAGREFTSVIDLADAQGNLVSYENYPIIVKLNNETEMTGAISGTSGSVTFDKLKITKAGQNTVSYSVVGGVTARLIVLTVDVTVYPERPSSIEFIGGRDLWVNSGRTFGDRNAAIQVQVRDGFGNKVRDGWEVSASTSAAPGGHTVTGVKVVTSKDGVATFDQLKIVGPIGAYQVSVSAGGAPLVYPHKVTLSGGYPVALRVKRALAGFANRTVASVQPIIEVVDSAGNPSPAMNVEVEAWVNVGDTRYLADTAQSTNDGAVVFDSIMGKGVPGPARVEYITSMITPKTQTVVTQSVDLAPGPAVTYRRLSTATTVASGTPIGLVAAYDADGNRTPVGAGTVEVRAGVSKEPSARTAWLGGTFPFVRSDGHIDASGLRVYGLKGVALELTFFLGETKLLESTVTLSSDPVVGDPGPSFGTIGAILPKVVSPVTGITAGGRIIEIAPPGFSNSGSVTFNGLGPVDSGDPRQGVTKGKTAVGDGASNTKLLLDSLISRQKTGVARLVAESTYAGLSDWFLGSVDEYQLIETNLRNINKPYPFGSVYKIASSSDYSDVLVWGLSPTTKAKGYFSWLGVTFQVHPLRFVG